LYVALAALMLISCDPNAPKIPSKDNKTIDNLSKNVLSLLGEKKKAAVSTLEEFGFQEANELFSLPARLGLPAQTEASDLSIFFYGNIDAYEEAAEEEDIEILSDYLNEKKEIMLLVLVYYDGSNKVSSLSASIYAPGEVKNINSLYAKFSKNIFLSLDKGKEWEGFLVECDDIDDEDAIEEFTSAKKRDKFGEALAAMECPYAREQGSDEFDDDVYRNYSAVWIGDASAMIKGYDGLAMGVFQATLEIPLSPEP
jgi:hypothetical protein